MRNALLIALLASGVAAQDLELKPSAPAAEATDALPGHTKNVLSMGQDFANQLIKGVYQSRSTLIQAVYGATQMAGTGRITNTGTLTLVAGRWTYQPMPNDRLVVVAGPLVQEFVMLGATGNMRAANADAWLENNHTLRFRQRIKGVADVEVSDNSADGRFEFTVKGRAYHNKKPLNVHLKAAGTYFFQRDLAGYEHKTNYTLKGAMAGEGVRVGVDEEHVFRLIISQSPSKRPGIAKSMSTNRTVSYSDDTIRNRLTLGHDTYVWNARFVKDFVNGFVPPTMPTAWRCGGTLERNGKKWGRFRLDTTARRGVHGRIIANVRTIVLVTPEGKTILQFFVPPKGR